MNAIFWDGPYPLNNPSFNEGGNKHNFRHSQKPLCYEISAGRSYSFSALENADTETDTDRVRRFQTVWSNCAAHTPSTLMID
jgi:hypothetical protein